MNFGGGPVIEVSKVAGAIRVAVHPRFSIVRLFSLLLTGALGWIHRLDWARHILVIVGVVLFPVAVVTTIWTALRYVLSEEVMDVSEERITIRRSFFFGGNRQYPTDKISNFGIDDIGEGEKREQVLFFTYRLRTIQFARGIQAPEASRIFEVIGAMGGIGAVPAYDPFDGRRLTTLNLGE